MKEISCFNQTNKRNTQCTNNAETFNSDVCNEEEGETLGRHLNTAIVALSALNASSVCVSEFIQMYIRHRTQDP